MVFSKRISIGLAVAIMVLAAAPVCAETDLSVDSGSAEGMQAEQLPAASNDVPITQSVMGDGSIRYGVWIKVGERFVEAMLDSGSTGLRVLPAVVPGDLEGMPLEVAYGAGVDLKGLAVTIGVEIGALSAKVPIEVVDHFGCTARAPDCIVAKRGADYLIGGDGASGRGYSAILGTGFSTRSHDIPNPLEGVGATQWMIELPRPQDQDTGHLVLNPDAAIRAPFKMLTGTKLGDLNGCLQNAKHDQDVCGPILLDTGAPAIVAISEDQQRPAMWPPGTAATLKFAPGLALDFTAGDVGTVSKVAILPAKQKLNAEVPFIVAGLLPYLSYDVLYDASEHKVGLKRREK